MPRIYASPTSNFNVPVLYSNLNAQTGAFQSSIPYDMKHMIPQYPQQNLMRPGRHQQTQMLPFHPQTGFSRNQPPRSNLHTELQRALKKISALEHMLEQCKTFVDNANQEQQEKHDYICSLEAQLEWYEMESRADLNPSIQQSVVKSKAIRAHFEAGHFEIIERALGGSLDDAKEALRILLGQTMEDFDSDYSDITLNVARVEVIKEVFTRSKLPYELSIDIFRSLLALVSDADARYDLKIKFRECTGVIAIDQIETLSRLTEFFDGIFIAQAQQYVEEIIKQRVEGGIPFNFEQIWTSLFNQKLFSQSPAAQAQVIPFLLNLLNPLMNSGLSFEAGLKIASELRWAQNECRAAWSHHLQLLLEDIEEAKNGSGKSDPTGNVTENPPLRTEQNSKKGNLKQMWKCDDGMKVYTYREDRNKPNAVEKWITPIKIHAQKEKYTLHQLVNRSDFGIFLYSTASLLRSYKWQGKGYHKKLKSMGHFCGQYLHVLQMLLAYARPERRGFLMQQPGFESLLRIEEDTWSAEQIYLCLRDTENLEFFKKVDKFETRVQNNKDPGPFLPIELAHYIATVMNFPGPRETDLSITDFEYGFNGEKQTPKQYHSWIARVVDHIRPPRS